MRYVINHVVEKPLYNSKQNLAPKCPLFPGSTVSNLNNVIIE